MPIYDLYRETTTREHYRIEAKTPEAAFAIYKDGDACATNYEVLDVQPPTITFDDKLVLDTANLPDDDEEAEPETQTFTCKVGMDAREYVEIEIQATDADAALVELRRLAADGFHGAKITDTSTESDGERPVSIYIRDESEDDHHELVPLDYEPFEMPQAIVSYLYSGSTFDQFARLRSMTSELIDDNDKEGREAVRKIIAHLEAKLSPETYSRRMKTARELKATIDEARQKAVDSYTARLAP